MTYVLIMMVWMASVNTSGAFVSAEFANKQACEQAARLAKSKFSGNFGSFYYLCLNKMTGEP